MKLLKIKQILEGSNYNTPVIIRTKYGFTKFWKEKEIKFLSWGKNWTDKNPSSIDIDSAADLVLKSMI
jgi:hypothetical protein